VTDLYAFVDESERPGRYLMCSVVIEPTRLGELRRATKAWVLPGQQRVHFKKEAPRRRREIASALARLELDVSVFVCRSATGRGEAESRALCLAAIVEDLQDRDVPVTLLLESRHHQDADDHAAISRARRPRPALSYEHVDADHDPLLWLPDAFAWLVGAGRDWRRRIEHSISKSLEVG
jgi:hypothetical protein